ncbi:MAG: hypothetical protein INR69_19200 [Mucilaginibacter polytrichastri]|nr:hypothetical protein [Mucilaginibacter polytrichastri]
MPIEFCGQFTDITMEALYIFIGLLFFVYIVAKVLSVEPEEFASDTDSNYEFDKAAGRWMK